MLKNLLAAVVTLSFLATPNMVSAQEKTILQVGLGDPIDSEMGAIGTRFKEVVEARSGGRVEVQLFPSGQLGDETEMIQNVRAGNLDIAVVGIANTVPFVKKLGILTMPYIFDDLYDVVRATTGPAHDLLNGYAVNEGGFRILGWTYTDYRYLSNSRKPIRNLNDIRGMKFRVPQSAVLLASYKAWGANPIPLSWAETFTALQQGVVDGQEGCFNNVVTLKFYEAQKYATMINYSVHSCNFVAGERWLQSLPENARNALIRAGKEAMLYERTKVAGMLEADDKLMQEHGMELLGVVEDLPEWVRLGRTAWPKCYEVIGGGDAKKGKAIMDVVMAKKKALSVK